MSRFHNPGFQKNFDRGAQAARSGKSRDECPFKVTSQMGKIWLMGYDSIRVVREEELRIEEEEGM